MGIRPFFWTPEIRLEPITRPWHSIKTARAKWPMTCWLNGLIRPMILSHGWKHSWSGQISSRLVGAEPISLAQFAPMMAGGAPGPTREDVEAAGEMSADEQNEFIRSMVARLADRLAEEPDDLDGWMRLGNAYKVLNEVDQAIDAYEKAQDLLEGTSSQDPRRAAVAQALSELGDQ